ncbi:MAG: C4-type zinc ribbon domain-containing protein [candidate division WOR-3 bacterium]|nr:C4-type zinc ribbon domain-containing protein [candidate division WOR-3 bacterium]MCX7757784.1 C4-type zinc ribbon domain-containing protein [candidate division WOR-3 bacterium]MDW7987498.1 C4-type zinc ribbon domain-containing protein [candidate division WOR-3 bacterium]
MNVKEQINLLRSLEELDLILRDMVSPAYKKIGFKSTKPTLEFMKTIEKERNAIAKKIEPRLLREYDIIMQRYGGRVVVQVINGFCGGCYSRLPSEYATRSANNIMNCPHCGRFLYWLSRT